MTKNEFEKLKEIYLSLGPQALSLNHYELSNTTKYGNPILWKEFLMEPEIRQHINEETALIRQAELNKITTDLKGSRSVGQAQLINALQKLEDNNANPDGPVYIYTYVPLSADQKDAPNVHLLSKDIFLKEDAPEIPIEQLEHWHLKPVFIVSEIGTFWGIVNNLKKFIVVPDMPNLNFDKLEEKGIKLYPNEVKV